ncbi:MAG: hypothetical protein QOI77_3198 [Blastocatellia bacterium]|jgi:hypothetical protein|nr:hypothetical protein [Blastocatellia bacterium]
MTKPIRILLQTTIPYAEDNWHVGRFSLLRDELSSMKDPQGSQLCAVTTRNREADLAGNDPVLSTLDKTDFDELWLFAIDNGDGLSVPDCQGITRFRQRGGGIMATRDHQDLGISLCTLGGIGRAHFFHSKHPEPDADRRVPDDKDTSSISWPNYHSGANGDYQTIAITFPHELLRRNASADNLIEFFPAHPHEGAVGVPEGEDHARVIATGKSEVTDRPFNLVVAFESSPDEHGNTLGRGIAESSFHHFADYNWNTDMGCPSFLEEPPGDGYKRNPQALEDIKTYVRNAAVWLSGD